MTATLAHVPAVSRRLVTLPAPGRGTDLQVRVCAPATGERLPVVVLSHGYGGSAVDYDPLVDVWTARGLAVVQPTHLDSRTLALAPEDPRTPTIWTSRVDDLRRVIDALGSIEEAVPGLAGRLDRDRVAVAGHSWGGQSVGMLLGARVLDATGRPGEDRADARVTAGVLLATTGTGGADLTPFAAEHFAFMSPDFSGLRTPTLVVAGDHDQSLLSSRGPDWFTDPYLLSPGATDLLTLAGAEHSLGGITGYRVTETTDESPELVALVAEVTAAYLLAELAGDRMGWVRAAAVVDGSPLGRLSSKAAR